ncbi:hypothetical protein [Pseudomonas japonica]|uniref:hypothetical protein n=1 Tax=Pseudomonas japonica TaxID=256466 RepID=UPI003A895281
MEKVIVTFTGAWRGYSKGEVAGFEKEVAESLVEGGRAEFFEGKKAGKAAGKSRSAPAPATAPQPGPGPDGDGNTEQNAGGGSDDDDVKP